MGGGESTTTIMCKHKQREEMKIHMTGNTGHARPLRDVSYHHKSLSTPVSESPTNMFEAIFATVRALSYKRVKTFMHAVGVRVLCHSILVFICLCSFLCLCLSLLFSLFLFSISLSVRRP